MLKTMRSQPFLRVASASALLSTSRGFSNFAPLTRGVDGLSVSGIISQRNSNSWTIISTNTLAPKVALFSTKNIPGTDDDTGTAAAAAAANNDEIINKKENEDDGVSVSSSEKQEFASSYHAPVMYKECIDAMMKRSHTEGSSKKNKYKNKSKVGKKEKRKGKVSIEEDKKEKDSARASGSGSGRPKIYVDGTLGGGGHSQCLLQNISPGDILLGCDVDPSALATASTRLREYIVNDNDDGSSSSSRGRGDKPIFIPVQSNFRDLFDNVKDLTHPLSGEKLFYSNNQANEGEQGDFIGVDGILLDLGVSSHQIDNAERGFAFMKDGPLDMRMWGGQWDNQVNESQVDSDDDDTNSDGFKFVQNKKNDGGGMTAADICNAFTDDEISRILKVYSDEPRAWKIAQAIVRSRPLKTTGDLKEAVAMVTPEFAKKGRRMGRTATLARVFQALRIVVNDEDAVLRDAFEEMAPSLVKKGGRLVVLAYHSMEDRAAKRVMRDGTVDGSKRYGSSIQKDMFGNEIVSDDGSSRPWKTLGKKMKATQEEVEVNSRARSATLRVAERL